MIVSMTGYGKFEQHLDSSKLTVEIKTLNSKNLDINMRLASSFKDQEIELRKLVSQRLLRGKIDISISIEEAPNNKTQQINPNVIAQYIDQLREVSNINLDRNSDGLLLQIASQFPDIFSTNPLDTTNLNPALVSAVNETIDYVCDFRINEGSALETDFRKRIQTINTLLANITETDKSRLAQIRARLDKAVQDIKEQIDRNRFEQELIFYLEKYDITEEKVRLQNHLNYFITTMDSPTSQGKKLGFIGQEIGREINTIGSKANDAQMQQLVVQMKDELEKIKEQLLNVL